jgi:threonine-phosphate decarboxylase
MTSHEVSEILLRKGIPVRDASNFIYLNEKYIRVAVKDRESNTALIDALNDIM